ncbi:MAG: hypothetical protein HFE91_10985 [Acutalibacter sp.]|jgi:putative membrane protein|uniref:hypothetical protein n=1 Tax=Acutalibacter sp. TaxID=1918636 RepID=UPI0021705A14|nr:hypothetical protein [Acutalibacter sp.]MCI9225972.1 hypothetical protein [Acutalibacter sp.]
MKIWKRALSVGLSALMVAGCALPALAAEDIAEKSETVYVVLEPDGSVRSQTVSIHLHNESGLSEVTDRSVLTGIENTHDTTAFTQEGEKLRWDTDGTDVYYKGETVRKAPVSAEITYELDGAEIVPEALAGKSGRVKLTVKLVNNETSTVQIDGKPQPVCTPFVTMVAAVLGEGWTGVSAEHGKITGAGSTQAVGFVCLPGVRECLEGIGSEKLEGLEDRLLDEVSIEGSVKDFTLPDILIACATDTEALREEGFSGLDELDGGMDSLRDGMDELLDGADSLAAGAESLQNGAAALLTGVHTLSDGAQRLMDGTAQLQTGARKLSSGAAEARDGAAALQTGADSLAAGLHDLQSGAGALYGGYIQLKDGADDLASGLNTLQGKGQALADGIGQITTAVGKLHEGAGPVMLGARAFGGSLAVAASSGAELTASLPDPALFAPDEAHAADPVYQQLLAAYTGAYSAATGMAGGMAELDGSYSQVLGSLEQVSAGIDSLHDGANGSEGLAAGIAAYTQGVADAASGAARLQSGLGQLGAQLPALTGGVDQLIAGSNQLSAGAGSLSQGNAALADGAAQLAQGTDDLAAGTAQLLDGIQALADGAASLHDGTVELSDGASALWEGLGRFDSEGISRLTGAVDAEKLPALRTVTKAMRGRMEDYGSFAGAPEGSEVTTKFVMKTAGQVQEDIPAHKDTAWDDAQEPESFWQRVTALFGK